MNSKPPEILPTSPAAEELAQPPNPRLPQNREYWCFISYRHADNKQPGRQWATWLHQAIETYEVPADLVGSVNERGDTIPERIFPVFRDEEELPADADLASPIYAALDRSKFLVVLCSPRAAQSPYVSNEIAYFKKIGRSERILAAIVDGEPNASDHPGKTDAASECFPKALRFGVDAEGQLTAERTEPIAADFRLADGTEGWTSPGAYRQAFDSRKDLAPVQVTPLVDEYQRRQKLMLLKILAGIMGVPLGVLTKRDQAYQLEQAKRHQRVLGRWLALVGVLAVVALAASGATLWQRHQAEIAKDRAIVAKKAADELIGYMQYDLSRTLGKFGHHNMMEGINARIRQYHKEFNSSAVELDAAQRDRSEALTQQGNILFAKGDLPGALKAYTESLSIDRDRAQHDPQNDIWKPSLARNLANTAAVLAAQGELTRALDGYRSTLRLREILAKKEPRNSNLHNDLCGTHIKIGRILSIKGDFKGALDEYLKSLAICEAWSKKYPNESSWQNSLAGVYEELGKVYEYQENWKEAQKAYTDSLAITQELVRKDPENTFGQVHLANSHNHLGRLLLNQGDGIGSLTLFRKGLAINEALAKNDPDNMDWQSNLSNSQINIGDSLVTQGDLAGALSEFQNSLALTKILAQKLPDNKHLQHLLSGIFGRIGFIFFTQGNYANALQSNKEAIFIMEQLNKIDPDNLFWLSDLSMHLVYRSKMLIEQSEGNRAEVQILAERGLAILDEIENKNPLTAEQESAREMLTALQKPSIE